MGKETQIKAFVTKSSSAINANAVATVGFYVNEVKLDQKTVVIPRNQLVGNCVFNWTPGKRINNLKVKIETVNIPNANKLNDVYSRNVFADYY